MRFLTALLVLALMGCSRSAPNAGGTPAAKGDYASTKVAGAKPAAKVNLNSASEETFQALAGVGDKMAHEFVEYRPYVSIRQFRQEMGKYVDEAQVAAFEKLVFVPVVVNECDAETLAQIPGVDAALAETLMAGRPYASNDAFIEALAAHLDALNTETAKTYLASP